MVKAPPYLTIDAELRRALNVRAAERGITVTNALECAIQLSGETRRSSDG